MSVIKKYTTKNIFISSTFIDMQVERDFLNKKVLPIVKEFALKYYINIEFVDLRFGIDIGNKNLLDKVINTCGDEIIRCKPLFIGFLGNRFGTEIDDSEESITSFEIHKAISENCESLFYFRNITNFNSFTNNDKYVYKDEKVNELKKELLERFPDSCKNYDSYYDELEDELVLEDSFVNKVASDINSLIKRLYEEDNINNSTPHFEYLSFLYKDYIDLDEEAHYFLSKLFLFEEKIDLFIGPNGSGKSLLVANLAKENEDDTLILPYYTEVSEELSLINLLNTYIEMMKIYFNESYEFVFDEEEAVSIFYQLLSRINEKCIIIIDDFKHIKDGLLFDKYSWIRVDEIPNNVRFFIVTSSGVDAEKLEIDSYVWHTSQVNYRICKNYLDGYLLQKNQKVSKEFYDMLFNELLLKCDRKSIMYLKIYLDYIFFNDRHDAVAINKLSNEVIENDLTKVDRAVLDFYTSKIKNMDTDLGLLLPKLLNKKIELLDKDLANLILALISTMKNGVRESDIIEIATILNIKYVANEFAYLRKILPSYFYQQKDGSWIIPNYSIKNSLRKHYLKDIKYITNVNNAILEYFYNIDDNDEIKLANIMPLLYEKGDLAEFKRLTLFMIDNNKTHYVEELLLDICYRKQDFDLLVYLLYGYSPNKQEQINCYITNLLCKYSSIDYDVFVNSIPYEVEDRIDSNSKAIRYFFARINLELCLFNQDETHLEFLVEEFMDLYIKTKNINVKHSIIDSYFKMIELSTNKRITRKLIKSLFEILDSVIDKDRYYYKNLCMAYIKYMDLNKNHFEIINKHIYDVLNLIDLGYRDYKICDDVINLLFVLFGHELILNNYFKAKEYLDLMSNLANKFRYSVRSAEASKKMLIIDFYYLIIKSKLENLEVDEINNLWEKVDALDRISYEKELEISCDFYLRALEVFKSIIANDNQDLIRSLNNLSNKINKYDTDIYEIYTLVYFTLEIIQKENISNDEIDINYIKKVFKKIYKTISMNEYKRDFLTLKCKKDILSYLGGE